MHVGAGGQFPDGGAPDREHCVTLVGAHSERTAKVVQHDLYLGAFARHLGQGLDLRVVDPGFEGQIVRRQPLQAAAEIRIVQQPRRRHIRGRADDRRVVRRDLADAAKAPAGRFDLPFEHRLEVCRSQIGKTDDPGADLRPGSPTIAFLGDRPDEFAFADRPHLFGTGLPVAGAALDEDGCDDVVPGIDIGQQLVEQIAAARVIPQMMVRIDDRKFGLEDVLGQFAEPFRPRQRARIGADFDGQIVYGARHELPTARPRARISDEEVSMRKRCSGISVKRSA